MGETLIDTFIQPNWPAPANVKALQTTRHGGLSVAPFNTLNFGDHVNDNALHVVQNRQLLSSFVPTEPVWLNQVHGVRVINAAFSQCVEEADASFTKQHSVVCAVMTADCLPIILCDEAGTVVAAIHAGWRSLCDGVIEATVSAMSTENAHLMAWLGPAIGPNAFEVGIEVRDQFILQDAAAKLAFKPHGEKWLGNLYQIAIQRLNKIGVTNIYGGGVDEHFCTFSDETRFFSFRRDQVTGRMASLIWLQA